MKNKKQRRVMFLLILILGLTIGFALLSTTLKINGTAGIKSNTWNIHWNDSSINVTTGSVEAEEPVISKTTSNKDTVSFDVELDLPGDFYEFEIDAINEGSIDGALDLAENFITYKIEDSESTLPSYMDFKVTYDDNTTPTSGDVLKATESKTYKIRVEYKSNVEELPSNPKPVTIEVELPYVQHKENKIKYDLGEIVYFDPTSESPCNSTTFDLNKVRSNTSKCYKWRVITHDDTTSKTSIKLQLDHNLLTSIPYNAYPNSASPLGPMSAFTNLPNMTTDWNRVPLLNYTYTYSYDETNPDVRPMMRCVNGDCILDKETYDTSYGSNHRARMITMEEVFTIFKAINNNFNWEYNWNFYDDHGAWWHTDFSNVLSGTGKEKSALSWLMENTYANTDWGTETNIYGSATYGYWTMTPDYSDSYRSFAYYIHNSAYVDSTGSANTNFGVRPVVEINKSMITKE